MPLSDLGKVTATLQTLLSNNVARLTQFPTVTVTPAPPELVTTAAADTGFTRAISLHLFHAEEDPYYKNFEGASPPPRQSPTDRFVPDVATASMALKLHYVVTAHTLENANDLEDSVFLTRHQLFGAALKTMHDFPVITDDTKVLDATGTGIVDVMHDDLKGRGNTIQIVLRPMKPEDSITYWSTQDKIGARLSAFYEVRVVLLEPERPRAVARGIVLSVGNFVFPQGTPHLLVSRSSVGFRLPADRGGAGQRLAASPARPSLVGAVWPPVAGDFRQPFVPPVTLASVQDALSDNPEFTLVGGDLTRDQTSLVLRSARFQNHIGTTRPVIKQANNPSWYVGDVSATEGTFRVQPSFVVGSTTVPILPGTYGAALSVVRFIPQVGALPRELGTLSNEVPVIITPQIITINDASPVFDAIIGGNYLPTTLSPSPYDALQAAGLDVQLYVGGVAYTPNRTTPSLDNELIVVDDHTLRFTLTPELVTLLGTEGFLSVRLVVNGAEAPAIWLQSGGAP